MLRRVNYLPVMGLRQDMDRLFNEFARGLSNEWPFSRESQGVFPPVNVWEDEGNLYAEAELPGLKMDDLEVFVLGEDLTIKGKRGGQELPQATYHRRERGAGEFSRVIRLPVDVNADKVGATLRDGVLTVTLPKAESVLPRRIEVKS